MLEQATGLGISMKKANYKKLFIFLLPTTMEKTEKTEFLSRKSIGYISALSGCEIKDFEYWINDYIIFVAWAWTWKPTVHKAKIRYTRAWDPYFLYNGYTLKLSDSIRM